MAVASRGTHKDIPALAIAGVECDLFVGPYIGPFAIPPVAVHTIIARVELMLVRLDEGSGFHQSLGVLHEPVRGLEVLDDLKHPSAETIAIDQSHFLLFRRSMDITPLKDAVIDAVGTRPDEVKVSDGELAIIPLENILTEGRFALGVEIKRQTFRLGVCLLDDFAEGMVLATEEFEGAYRYVVHIPSVRILSLDSIFKVFGS